MQYPVCIRPLKALYTGSLVFAATCAANAAPAASPPAEGATTATHTTSTARPDVSPLTQPNAAASGQSGATTAQFPTATQPDTISPSQPDTDATMSKPNPLSVGAKAPVFTYRTADGQEHSTANLHGKPFVVYFYPKDMTPGCTTQACGFRDSYADYEKAGLAVIGVSADSEESHGKFRSKHELPFGLASDPERKVIEAYGVWGPKLFMGNSFLGIHRISFLVGPDGTIAKVYPKVKVADHAETVLADARELGLIP